MRQCSCNTGTKRASTERLYDIWSGTTGKPRNTQQEATSRLFFINAIVEYKRNYQNQVKIDLKNLLFLLFLSLTHTHSFMQKHESHLISLQSENGYSPSLCSMQPALTDNNSLLCLLTTLSLKLRNPFSRLPFILCRQSSKFKKFAIQYS